MSDTHTNEFKEALETWKEAHLTFPSVNEDNFQNFDAWANVSARAVMLFILRHDKNALEKSVEIKPTEIISARRLLMAAIEGLSKPVHYDGTPQTTLQLVGKIEDDVMRPFLAAGKSP